MNKTYFFFLLSFLFCSTTLWAQATVESLQQQIAASKGEKKVDLLLELATLLGGEQDDYLTAIEYAEQALSLAENIDYKIGKADAYLRIGSGHGNLKNYTKAEEAYLNAQDLYQELDDDDGYYMVHIRRGVLAFFTGDLKQSEKFFQESIDFLSKGDDLELLAEVHSYLGLLFQNNDRLDEAFDNYTMAVNLYKQSESPESPELAGLLINLADIYIVRQNYQTALDLYLESLTLRESYEEESVLAYLYRYISGLYDELLDYEKSIEYTLKSLQIHQKQGNIQEIMISQNKLSGLYYEVENYQKALNNNKELLDLYELSDSTDAYNSILIDIGICYQRLGSYTLALQYYEKAKQAHLEQNDQETVAAILVNTSEVYMFQEEFDKAIIAMQEAIDIRENNPESSLEVIYLSKSNLLEYYNYMGDFDQVMEMGTTWAEEIQGKNILYPEMRIYREVSIALGNVERLQEAAAYRKKALALSIQLSDNYAMADDYGFLILVYDKLGDCEAVLQYCEESIPFYEQLDAKTYLAGIYYNAGFCYFELGDTKKGFAFYKKSLEKRKVLGENETAGLISFQIGEKHQALEEYEQAISYYEQAKEYLIEESDIQYVDDVLRECRQKAGK